jgi:hypothetical protein
LVYRWRTQGWDRYAAGLTTVALLAAAAQAYLIATNSRPSPPANPTPLAWVGAVGYNLPGGLYLGHLLPSVPSTTAVLLGASVLFALTLYAVFRLPTAERRLALVFLFCGAIAHAAALHKFRADPFLIDNFEHGPRYLYIPYVFACWVYVLLVARGRGFARCVGAVAGALVAVSSATYFRIPPLPDLDWRGHVRRYRESGERIIPVNPGWQFDIDRPTPEDQFP